MPPLTVEGKKTVHVGISGTLCVPNTNYLSGPEVENWFHELRVAGSNPEGWDKNAPYQTNCSQSLADDCGWNNEHEMVQNANYAEEGEI